MPGSLLPVFYTALRHYEIGVLKVLEAVVHNPVNDPSKINLGDSLTGFCGAQEILRMRSQEFSQMEAEKVRPSARLWYIKIARPGLDLPSHPLIYPDYTISIAEVFRRLAEWMLVQQQNHLYLLESCSTAGALQYEPEHSARRRDLEKVAEERPSWVSLTDIRAQGYLPALSMSWSEGAGHRTKRAQSMSLDHKGYILSLNLRRNGVVALVSQQAIGQDKYSYAKSYLAVHQDPFYSRLAERFGVLPTRALQYLVGSLQDIYASNWRSVMQNVHFKHALAYRPIQNVTPEKIWGGEPTSSIQQAFITAFVEYMQLMYDWHGQDVRSERHPQFASLRQGIEAFSGTLAVVDTEMFETADGKLGWTVVGTAAGDVVAIICEIESPVILRPLPNGRFTFIGPCWFLDAEDTLETLEYCPVQRIEIV